MIDKDPNHLSRPVREGKSMGEFGTTDTTRTEGKQGWKVKKQIRTKEIEKPQVETKQGTGTSWKNLARSHFVKRASVTERRSIGSMIPVLQEK